MKKRTQSIIAALLIYVMLPLMMVPTSATTPSISHKYGSVARGAMSADNNGNILLERESITLNISSVPDYNNQHDEPYENTIAVDFTLVNPYNEESSTTLLVPISTPEDYEERGKDPVVSLNGEILSPQLRHSYSKRGQYYNSFVDLAQLSDTPVYGESLSESTTVTKYTFTLEGLTEEQNEFATLSFKLDPLANKDRFFFVDGEVQLISNKDDTHTVIIRSRGSSQFDLYVFGAPLEEMPEITVQEYYYNGDELSCDVKFSDPEQISLSDFIYKSYDPEGPISQIDWHNLVTYEFDHDEGSKGCVKLLEGYKNKFDGYTLAWITKNITIAPMEKAVFSVEMPIYPDVQFHYTPEICDYTYYYSNISSIDHTTVDITLNTEYHVIESHISGYSEELSGSISYDLDRSRHSGSNLRLSICEEAEPTAAKDQISIVQWILLIVFLPIVLIIVLLNWVKDQVNSSK